MPQIYALSIFYSCLFQVFKDRPRTAPSLAQHQRLLLKESGNSQPDELTNHVQSRNRSISTESQTSGVVYLSIYDVKSTQKPSYIRSLKELIKSVPYILLMIAYGILVGTYYAISTLLNAILTAYFADDAMFGWIGFVLIISGILGAVLAGIAWDKTKKFRLIIILTYLMTVIGLAVYTGTLQFHSLVIVFICAFVLGFFMTAYLALGFEYAAELTYPIDEGLSSGLLNTSAQIFGIILTLISAKLLLEYNALAANLCFLVACAIGCILTIFAKGEMKRQTAQKYDHDLDQEWDTVSDGKSEISDLEFPPKF